MKAIGMTESYLANDKVHYGKRTKRNNGTEMPRLFAFRVIGLVGPAKSVRNKRIPS